MTSTPANEPFGLEQLLHAVLRRWRVVVACTAVVTAAALGFTVVLHKHYSATATLMFEPSQFAEELFGVTFSPMVDDLLQNEPAKIDGRLFPVAAQRTATALRLTSAKVRDEVSVSKVAPVITIPPTPGEFTALVTAADASRFLAARIANTYAQQYLLLRRQADRARILAARSRIQRELASLPPSQRKGSVGQALADRVNQLGIFAGLQTGFLRVSERATLPTASSNSKLARNGLLGIFLGLLCGIGVVFLTERRDRRPPGGPTPSSPDHEGAGYEGAYLAEEESTAAPGTVRS